MTSTELFAQATALDALAGDVEGCVDAVKAIADTPDWECDNATEVRTNINHWRSAARTAAANLREEASRVRGDARRAAQREADEREAERRERQMQ